jgi:tetratricopeptide (TPR) repeat protein
MNKGSVAVSLLLCFVTPSLWVSLKPPVLAQTQSDRKAEAESLLNLCREHLSKNQPEAAIQSCQQAVAAHQQIKDRSGEAKSTVNLGIAHVRVSQYEQAIPILQSASELARIAGERRVEALD